MLISALTPAAAWGSERATLRRICSADCCEVRPIPCPPRAWNSWRKPARSCGSGISSISCAAPWSTPRSVALRPQSPSGSRSRSIAGTTVSHTAFRIARSPSESTFATSSSLTAWTLPGLARQPTLLNGSRLPGGIALGEDEVVPVHRFLGGVREELPDLVGAQALDLAELGRRVVDDPLADRLAIGGDLDRVAGLELAVDLGDPDRQQAAATLAQHPGGAVVDPQGAVARLRVAEPELEAGGTLRVGREAGPGGLPGNGRA